MRLAPTILSAFLLSATTALAAPAPADDLPLDIPLPPTKSAPQPSQPAQPPPPSGPAFLIGAQVGPTFPGIFNKLSVSGIGAIEAAYQLPFLERQLGVFLQVGYSQPSSAGSIKDKRLAENDGVDSYQLSILDLGLSLGVDYVLPLPSSFLAFAAAGVELHLSRSTMSQKLGSVDLGTTTEDSARVGYLLRLGAGYQLGPGYLTLEIENEYTGIDHLLTGVTNTAHLSTAVGYLLRL